MVGSYTETTKYKDKERPLHQYISSVKTVLVC
jgi:hypothetical protein